MIGNNGVKLIDDTNAHTFPFRGIVIREETVISAWTDSDGFDLVNFLDISGATLLVSDPLLMIPSGKINGSITLTSGSIWAIL